MNPYEAPKSEPPHGLPRSGPTSLDCVGAFAIISTHFAMAIAASGILALGSVDPWGACLFFLGGAANVVSGCALAIASAERFRA